MRVADLIHALEPVPETATGGDVYARFQRDPHLLAVAVVDEAYRPVGLLTRAGFALKMADRFGRALYEKRSVKVLLTQPPLLVDIGARLEALNAIILKGGDGALLDGFIGVDDGRYVGIGTGIDVLRATAEASVRTSQRLAAEREKAKSVEIALLDLFRRADALAASKHGALVRRGAATAPAPAQPPADLSDLFPRIQQLFADIGARDEALIEALEAAEAASNAKTRFLANTTHELRTPLNAIIGYAELVEEEAVELGAHALLNDTRRIASAGRHLLRLINDILDMSKIEAGGIDVCWEEVDLASLIAEAADAVLPQARANNNRLHVDAAATGAIVSDALRLRQCLVNLLANAVKFTKDGLVAVRAVTQGDAVRIEIVDSGIGMSAEQLARLFAPFVQADARIALKYGGTGLGLAITKRLANLLGGDVSVVSEVGVGSCFTLVVPRDARQALPQHGRSAEAGAEAA